MLKRSSRLLLFSCLSFCLMSCASNLAERRRQADASRRLGEGYLAEANPTAALGEFFKAEKLYKKDERLQNDIGLAYFDKGEFESAIAHFKKALDLKPEYSEARNNLGIVYLRLEQWDNAIECFNRASTDLLYATPHFALNNLGEAYRGKKDYELSIGFYNKALKADPRFPRAHRGLGLTYMAMEDYEAAISSLEKAVQYAPRFANAYFDLGRAYAGQTSRGKAVLAFKKVVELVPDTPLAESALAEIRKLEK